MNVARWVGALAAVLVLGCAGQQTRTAAAQPRDAARGGGANPTATQEQAPSERPTAGSRARAGSGSADVKELDEVYGQVNRVTKNELEIEPAYGDPVKLKLDAQTIGAQASAMPREGDEVRASYEERGSDKVAVDVRTGADAAPAASPSTAGQPMTSEPSSSGSSTTR